MYEDRKTRALVTWRKLLDSPEIRMTAQEQYEELLRLAEEYLKQGFIDRDERKHLVTEATERYARAVEGVGGGAKNFSGLSVYKSR
jgi:lipopolysaccharide biosynthesis regulator YciM